MKINRTGITRLVVEVGRWVIKVPNFTYSWSHFLKGLISNINENNCWKWTKSELLCPVIWASWGGWVVIMERCDVERHYQEVCNNPTLTGNPEDEVRQRYRTWIESGFGGDDKCDNYGYLGDRLVKVDYGQ